MLFESLRCYCVVAAAAGGGSEHTDNESADDDTWGVYQVLHSAHRPDWPIAHRPAPPEPSCVMRTAGCYLD